MQASGVLLSGCLRLGIIRLSLGSGLIRVLVCCGISGLRGVCGAGRPSRREQLTKLVGDLEEELLAILCSKDERGVS